MTPHVAVDIAPGYFECGGEIIGVPVSGDIGLCKAEAAAADEPAQYRTGTSQRQSGRGSGRCAGGVQRPSARQRQGDTAGADTSQQQRPETSIDPASHPASYRETPSKVLSNFTETAGGVGTLR